MGWSTNMTGIVTQAQETPQFRLPHIYSVKLSKNSTFDHLFCITKKSSSFSLINTSI